MFLSLWLVFLLKSLFFTLPFSISYLILVRTAFCVLYIDEVWYLSLFSVGFKGYNTTHLSPPTTECSSYATSAITPYSRFGLPAPNLCFGISILISLDIVGRALVFGCIIIGFTFSLNLYNILSHCCSLAAGLQRSSSVVWVNISFPPSNYLVQFLVH